MPAAWPPGGGGLPLGEKACYKAREFIWKLVHGAPAHMAGRPGKKPQAPPPKAPVDELDDDNDNFDDEVPAVDADGNPVAAGRSRDWRDVEKYRELRDLKKLVGEDLSALFADRGKVKAKKRRR
jgi:hypothetical protein